MDDIKKSELNEVLEIISQSEETSSFDFKKIIAIFILNWQWFVLSIFISLCVSLIYLRYTDPVYKVTTKILIKDESTSSKSSQLANMQDLGFISNSTGIENEMEILESRRLALEAVKDLKLYTEYYTKGKFKEHQIYKYQPVTIDLDPSGLDTLNKYRIMLTFKLERKDGLYILNSQDKESSFEERFDSLPATIKIPTGTLTFTSNPYNIYGLEEGEVVYATIYPPSVIANGYASALSVEPTSKLTSIAKLTLTDKNIDRACDYLNQLALVYNRQANADKNEIAYKTEEFINNRLEKINAELGATEGELEDYKRRNNITQLRIDATQVLNQSSQYTNQLAQANTQMQLLDYLREYVGSPENKYQLIPSNVGLTDPISASLINSYNQAVQDRNRMLEAASENSPQVLTMTNTLDRLQVSIREALMQARKAADIQRQGIEKQYNLYQNKVANTPEQERILTQIGRQQEVKSGLYLMLLQKREENSISLAATADKGKLIDDPAYAGKVSPKNFLILFVALVLGFFMPLIIYYILQLLRYKIEGHDDVAQLTNLPIIADVAIASEKAKTAAGIVVHENKNNQTDEIFRAMRTNIQFMLNDSQKVILFTSSTSGEGKTFNAANLAVSFALLGKKTILVGLDIRKPALGRLFNITEHSHGITTLLKRENITKEDLRSQILPSNIHENLDLILSGPTPPNPTELLSRDIMKVIIDYMREDYDYIILDTAPIGLVTDTLQFGKYADVSVFVCRADYTPKDSLVLINSLAKEKKLPNMCIVVNGIDMSKKRNSYRYGYGRYGRFNRYGSYNYGNYGSYGNYTESHYGNNEDDSIKR